MLFKQSLVALALASTAWAQLSTIVSASAGEDSETSTVSSASSAANTASVTSSSRRTTSSSSSPAQTFAAGTTTISAYLFSRVSAAAVVTADACSTVLAIACADSEVDSDLCASAAALGLGTITYTARSTGNTATIAVTTAGVSGSLILGCSYRGTGPTFTGEVCGQTIYATSAGSAYSTSTTLYDYDRITPTALTITSGVDRLPTGSQSACTATPNTTGAPANTIKSSGTGTTPNAAAPTAGVYKVLVPVGAAIAAGAAML